MSINRVGIVTSAIVMLLVAPSAGAAQHPVTHDTPDRPSLALDRSKSDAFTSSVSQEAGSSGALAAGGLLGAGAGILAGGIVGAMVGGNTCSDPGNPDSCRGLEGFFLGASIAQAATIPLGVHLMNGRRGSYGKALLFTTGVAAAGLLAVYALDGGPATVGIAVSVPVAHLIGSVIIETKTSRATH